MDGELITFVVFENFERSNCNFKKTKGSNFNFLGLILKNYQNANFEKKYKKKEI